MQISSADWVVSQADWMCSQPDHMCSQALMAYLAANRSSSAASPQAPGKPQAQQAQQAQAQQAGLHQFQPDMLLRVKQLYSAFQSIVRVIQQA